jgi:hypothetical protein
MTVQSDVGRALIVLGVVIVLLGLLVTMRVPIGRLPGDFSFGGPGWKLYVPLGTCVLLSIVLSLVFYIVSLVSRR